MPIKVTCSNCGGVLHAPDDAGGKRGRCPTCGNVLPIPADSPKVPESHPAVEAAPGPKAKQSFGDYAAPVAPRTETPVRASAPAMSEPAREKRRAAASIPPPADFEKVEAKRQRLPDTRPVSQSPEVSEGQIRAWKRTRAGLGWMRSALFFVMIPLLFLPALAIYRHYMGDLAFIKPEGFLKVKGITGMDELWLAAIVLPIILALLCLMLGRLGFARVPHRVYARGLAFMSMLATLCMLAGMTALMFPPVSQFIDDNTVAWKLMQGSDNRGIIQRYGLAALVTGLLLSEFWFASVLGRIGTALEDSRTAARSTRYQILLGLLLAVAIMGGIIQPAVPLEGYGDVPKYLNTDLQIGWDSFVQTHWDNLKENKVVVLNGAAVLAALIFGLGYWRMLGAGRRAIRNWIEEYAPG